MKTSVDSLSWISNALMASAVLFSTALAQAHPCEGTFKRSHIDYLSDTADSAATIVKDYDGSEIRYGAVAYCPLNLTIRVAKLEGSNSLVLNGVDPNRSISEVPKSSYTTQSLIDDAQSGPPILATSASLDGKTSTRERVSITGSISASGGSLEVVKHRFFYNLKTQMKMDCSNASGMTIEGRYKDPSNDMDYVCTYVRQ